MLEIANKPESSDERIPDNTDPTSQEVREVPVTAREQARSELPIEPAAPWSQVGDTVAEPLWNAREVHKQLLRFSTRGGRAADAPAIDAEYWPALLYPYRDIEHFRHDYPICLPDETAGGAVLSVTGIIDALLDEIGATGDEGERLKRHLYQLESTLLVPAETGPGLRLSECWDRAATKLLSASTLPTEKKQSLEADLTRARQALQTDGEVIGCGDDVAGRLFTASFIAHWREHCRQWHPQIDGLVIQLEEILRADSEHSAAATTSEHLRSSAGKQSAEEVDFDKMSDILSHARLGEPVPAPRRARLEQTLAILRNMLPLFDPDACPDGSKLALPFSLAPIVDDCALASTRHAERMARMVDLFRAARVAVLEIDNRYRETIHDAYFAGFDASCLTAEELALCPPVILFLNQSSLAGGDDQSLLRLLSSAQPVKIVLGLSTLFGEDALSRAPVPTWPKRLASMTMGLDDVFIFQCSASRPALLESGFRRGLAYPGAALFCVYTGGHEADRRWPAFLDMAAAMDSRAFPAFCFDPGRGAGLSERMALLENSDPERDWPVETFQYLTEDGTQGSTELAFTLADFLCGDVRLSGHFWPVPTSLWHPEMLPLQAFLELDAEAAETRIPCLLGVTDDGQIVRIVVTRAMARATARCAVSWHSLQESAGINNSHALALLDRERQRLAEEQAREVAAIEQQYAARLDANLGDLTHEIVDRIARQLMGGAAGPPAIPLSQARNAAPSASAPPSAAQAPVAEAADDTADAAHDNEEELFALDAPYIDTPLCTSCDDCMTMSPHIFAYDENKQAYFKDAGAGTYRELVLAAEKCPVNIIHPGKPKNPDEPDLEQWIARAKPYI